MYTPIKASEAPFPYSSVPYTIVSTNGDVKWIHAPRSKTDKKNLIDLLRNSKTTKDRFIAAWPGKYRTDIFEIDDVDKAIKHLILEIC